MQKKKRGKVTLKGVEKLLFLRISRIEGKDGRIERGTKYRPVLADWTCRRSTMAGNCEPVPDQSFGGDRVLISICASTSVVSSEELF